MIKLKYKKIRLEAGDSMVNKEFFGETKNVEFKREIPSRHEKFLKDIIAFSNSPVEIPNGFPGVLHGTLPFRSVLQILIGSNSSF